MVEMGERGGGGGGGFGCPAKWWQKSGLKKSKKNKKNKLLTVKTGGGQQIKKKEKTAGNKDCGLQRFKLMTLGDLREGRRKPKRQRSRTMRLPRTSKGNNGETGFRPKKGEK